MRTCARTRWWPSTAARGGSRPSARWRPTRTAARELLAFADGLDGEREWAIEDCRKLSRHLESAAGGGRADPQGAAQADVRGSQLGAHVGKSDVIDALAVARAALREPDLRVAQLAGPEREIAPLLDHRANLVVERTRT